MRVSTMVRSGITVAALALLAACSETPSSPQTAAASVDKAALLQVLRSASNEAVALSSRSSRIAMYETDSGVSTFTVDPREAFNELVGPHYVKIPANSVCDLSSSYGPDQWEQSCEAAQEPFELTVSWKVVDGHSSVSFSPDLRFRASDDPAQWATLSMKDTTVTFGGNILWMHEGLRINESESDPSLLPYTDAANSRVTRRLKHFSGYVAAGFMEEVSDTAREMY